MTMLLLPEASLDRVLRRVGAIWGPDAAPHHLIYSMTGGGKTTLIKDLLGLCEQERVLILDPKPAADPVWDGPAEDPFRRGLPVTAVGPMFGHDGEPGGGRSASGIGSLAAPTGPTRHGGSPPACRSSRRKVTLSWCWTMCARSAGSFVWPSSWTRS